MSELYEISNFVTRKFQTLAYFGIDKEDIANSIKQMKLLNTHLQKQVVLVLDYYLYILHIVLIQNILNFWDF